VKIVSSAQNINIKNLLTLQKKSRERKKKKLFVVEGKKEIERALLGNYYFKIIFIREGSSNIFIDFSEKVSNFIIIKDELFDKITIRSGSEKFIGIGISKSHELEGFKLNKKAIILVAESIEKPGNIGALLRTSSGLGISAFILTNPKTDLYHPNIIRSSLGGIFSIPIIVSSSNDIISFFLKNNINIVSGALTTNSIPMNKANYNKPCAIVVGSESKGLEKKWIENSSEIVKINMNNNIDSLNVSVAAAILLKHCIDN
jgi:TrmH family RNA methyltransferase